MTKRELIVTMYCDQGMTIPQIMMDLGLSEISIQKYLQEYLGQESDLRRYKAHQMRSEGKTPYRIGLELGVAYPVVLHYLKKPYVTVCDNVTGEVYWSMKEACRKKGITLEEMRGEIDEGGMSYCDMFGGLVNFEHQNKKSRKKKERVEPNPDMEVDPEDFAAERDAASQKEWPFDVGMGRRF